MAENVNTPGPSDALATSASATSSVDAVSSSPSGAGTFGGRSLASKPGPVPKSFLNGDSANADLSTLKGGEHNADLEPTLSRVDAAGSANLAAHIKAAEDAATEGIDTTPSFIALSNVSNQLTAEWGPRVANRADEYTES